MFFETTKCFYQNGDGREFILMKQKLCLILSMIIMILHTVPIFAEQSMLSLESEAVILLEESTGKVLYEKNGYQKMYPASTTKVLTALVALENGTPEELIQIGREVLEVPLDASKAGHRPGEENTLGDLIAALMLPSGNDSAFVIASYIGKKTSSDQNIDFQTAMNQFAELMNARAKKAGAENTNFVNPHGYHDERHYTTAYDLALITREALKNPFLKEIVKKSTYTIGKEGNEKQRVLSIRNRNLLLDSKNANTFYPYATGGKTGYTGAAGECLVASASKDGMNLVAVVLNSPKDARWSDMKIVFDDGFENFLFHQVVDKGEMIDTRTVEKHAPKGPAEVEIIAAEEFTDLLHKKDISRIQKSIAWNEPQLIAPIEEGQQVGQVTYTLDQHTVAQIDLITKHGIEKRTLRDIIFSVQAVPYWLGTLGGGSLLVGIGSMLSKRKKHSGFRMR